MTNRLVLVDDHELFRRGVRAALEPHKEFRVVAEASDAATGFRAVAAHAPDLVVLDLALPDADGIDVARVMLRERPRLRIVALTMFAAAERVRDAFAAGIQAYAIKTERASATIDALRAAVRGERYLSPSLPRSLLEARVEPPGSLAARDARLSSREQQVFRLIARGLSTAKIAAELGISPKTVQSHRVKINAKLGVHSPAELVRLAALRGLVIE